MLLAALLVGSLSFPGIAIAGISAPDCGLTWEWSSNSLGQSACTVAAFMMSTCNAGSFTVDPLQPGYSYFGPGGVDDSNLCKCSTVGYSLISACAGCQGERWISWSEYMTNCTTTMPPSSFPNPVPSGTRVPQWALLDVTKENSWNANESFAVGDSPEVGPGRIPSPSASPISASGPTSAVSSPFSINSTLAFVETHRSNMGAIIGGVIGGIVAISILVAALFFYRRRQRSLVPPPVFEGDIAFDPNMDQVSQSTSSQGTVSLGFPETPTSLLRPYYMDYPITHSEYQVNSPPPAYISRQVPSLLPSGSLYAAGTMPNSQAQGNDGLPTERARFYPLNRSQ